MRYTAIPDTELEPSVICLGTVHVGSVLDDASSFRLLDTYLEHGGNFLDTAKIYSDWLPGEKSTSEKAIGRWLKQTGNRDRVILATKGGHPDPVASQTMRLARQQVNDDLHESLKNLRTEVVDLYWLHRDDVGRPVEEMVDTLDDLRKAGKIRYFGCSNWGPARIGEAQAYAHRRGVQGFVADQMMWSLAAVEQEDLPDKTMVTMNDQLRRHHLETSLAAIPYSSQANGLFQRMADDAIEPTRKQLQRMAGKPANRRRLERIKQVAADGDLSVTQVVLGYLLSQPFVTIPIIGPRTVDQLQDSLSAAGVKLTADEVEHLDGGE